MMKKWVGVILMVAGLVCVACGLYSVYLATSSTAWGSFDETAALVRSVHMSFSERLMLFTMENRIALLIGGAVAAVVGFFVRRSAK